MQKRILVLHNEIGDLTKAISEQPPEKRVPFLKEQKLYIAELVERTTQIIDKHPYSKIVRSLRYLREPMSVVLSRLD